MTSDWALPQPVLLKTFRLLRQPSAAPRRHRVFMPVPRRPFPSARLPYVRAVLAAERHTALRPALRAAEARWPTCSPAFAAHIAAERSVADAGAAAVRGIRLQRRGGPCSTRRCCAAS